MDGAIGVELLPDDRARDWRKGDLSQIREVIDKDFAQSPRLMNKRVTSDYL
jgi:hypothetical protein